jgi:hypothetical protein
MYKAIIALTLPLLLFSRDAFVQVEAPKAFPKTRGVVVAQAIPKFDLGWADEYASLLQAFTRFCVSNSVLARPNMPAEANEVVCGNLKQVIETEAEKRIALSQQTVAVFRRQGIASDVVLALVVTIVVSGILLAAYQLWIAATTGGPQSSTDLEASASKVRITSSSVGLAILTLSLLFLYLYVKEIYKINIVPVS